jgi:hypothetical protein
MLISNPAAILPFKFLGAPEGWIVTLIVLAVLALVVYFYTRETKDAGMPWKIFLGALRVIIFLIVLFVLFDPVPVPKNENALKRYSYVVVLLDSSLSMGLTDLYENELAAEALSGASGIPLEDIPKTPREDIVKKILEKTSFFDKLREKNHVRVYSFHSNISTVGNLPHRDSESAASPANGSSGAASKNGPVDLRNVEAAGTQTAIGNAITEAVGELKAERISAVVVISDGRSNTGIIEPSDAARRLGEARIPIYAVGVGNPTMPRNIKLSNLKYKSEVREGDWVHFDFMVEQQGFDGREVFPRVTLGDQSVEDIQPRTLVLKSGTFQHSIAFKPRKMGDYKVTIKVPPEPVEKNVADNELEGNLSVRKKQRIKVLYVEGNPRWEYRYLKTFLIRDTEMYDARVLLQSADPKFIQEYSPVEGAEPLTEFPKREELFKYNAIIFGDVDPDPNRIRFVISREDMENIKEFVSKGGAFIMIAGENHSPQQYAGTPIEDILPVSIEKLETGTEFNWHVPKTQSFRPAVTEEGWNHVIMRLEPDPADNRKLWQAEDAAFGSGLPGFYWYHPVREAKPGAVVLAEHPLDRDKTKLHSRRVLVAAQYYGRGTTFFTAVDETWRWRAGSGGKYFERFWGQVFRFSGKTIRYTLSTQDTYKIFDTVKIIATAKDQNYQPETAEQIKVQMTRPDGEKESIALKKTSPGEYQGTLKASAAGVYRVELAPEIALKDEEKVEKTFSVVVPNDELKDPFMNEPELRKLADLSSGAFMELSEIKTLPDKVGYIEETYILSAGTKPLIDTEWYLWFILVLFVAVITVEWVLRKYRKML